MHFSGLWQVPAVRALCVCLCASLSWALSLPCVWRRWDEALDDEMKKECSHCGWFCESQRDAARITSCLNLLGWAAEQPEPWIPVPWCTSEPLNPAGTWAAESHPYPELQPLLALPSPLCRRVLQACCSPNLSHIKWCCLQGTLTPSPAQSGARWTLHFSRQNKHSKKVQDCHKCRH